MSQVEPPAPPEAASLPPEAGADGGTEETQLADFFHTDDDLPRARRPRSARGPIEAPAFLERLLAPVTAVVVVIVVILLMIWINGGSTGTNLSNGTIGLGSRTASAKPTPTHHRHVAPAPSATSPVPTIPPAVVGPTTHHRAKARTGRSHHHAARSTATAPLVVLNNSTRSGLAHAVASQAAHKGWPVSQVGNLQRIVAKTTVYYAPGRHAPAVRLAHQFASVQRVAPNRAGHMHGHGLTLVVTRSWRL